MLFCRGSNFLAIYSYKGGGVIYEQPLMKSNRSVGTPCEWRKSVRLSHFCLYPRWSQEARSETLRFTLPNWILPENPILGHLWPRDHKLLLLMNVGFLFCLCFWCMSFLSSTSVCCVKIVMSFVITGNNLFTKFDWCWIASFCLEKIGRISF